MRETHPDGHLVAAVIPPDAKSFQNADCLRKLLLQMSSLAERLGTNGDFAVTTTDPAEVHVAFEQRMEAERLAKAVQASRVGQYYPGWATQWQFILDDQTALAIETALV
jgi:hypothetical protein